MKTIITITQLSEILQLSPRQIQMYVAAHVLPKVSKGRYCREDCISAYLDHKLLGPGSPSAKLDPVGTEYALEKIAYLKQRIAELEAPKARHSHLLRKSHVKKGTTASVRHDGP